MTRTLADYPVGSRWRDLWGHKRRVIAYSNGERIRTFHEGGDGETTWPLSAVSNWTRIDEPAPIPLPDGKYTLGPGLETAFEPAPVPACADAHLPGTYADWQRLYAGKPTPPTSDRRWEAALAALPWALEVAMRRANGNEHVAFGITVSLSLKAADALIAAMEAGK